MNINSKIAGLVMAGVLGLNLPFNLGKIDPNPRLLALVQRTVVGRAANLFGAKVTAINGQTLTVDKNGKTFTVNTDDKTHIRRRLGGKGSFSEISVNDIVNVIGKWADEAKTTINATLIRDMSVDKRQGMVTGLIKSLGSNSFVFSLLGNRGDVTVNYDGNTKFINRRGVAISSSDINVGDRVRVKGLRDLVNKTITEVTQVKDFSLPVRK